MFVVATAGHVDHGKSTLVRALTGMEPDRWAEERRRGMTIDLGYAWTTLDDGSELAFVDVPGHQKFVSNMLAGIGQVPAVLLVIAADAGWSQQTSEHVAALDALGVRHGVLAVTRSDLGDGELAIEEARDRLAGTSLASIEAVAVSPVANSGLDALRAALQRLVHAMPPVEPMPTRLWVDRVFTVRGAGTVVTGTLGSGSIDQGEELWLAPGDRPIRVRGLESLKEKRSALSAVARVAVNLRGVKADEVQRGDALVAPGRWLSVSVVDVRLVNAEQPLPTELVLHVGSAAIAVHLRPLGVDTARLTLRTALPLRVGERGLLRDPGRQHVVAGIVALDVLPPALRRRGAAARRADVLTEAGDRRDIAGEVRRRGVVRRSDLARAGIVQPGGGGVAVEHGDWLVSAQQWDDWRARLDAGAIGWATAHPLAPSLPAAAAVAALELPDPALLAPLIAAVGNVHTDRDGIRHVKAQVVFDPQSELALADLESRLAQSPFDLPEAETWAQSGLSEQSLAAAARTGRLIRLADGLYARADIVEVAVRLLAELPQPFTTSQAREAWQTTRRVAIPLLEMLDRRSYTRRIDNVHRAVRQQQLTTR